MAKGRKKENDVVTSLEVLVEDRNVMVLLVLG